MLGANGRFIDVNKAIMSGNYAILFLSVFLSCAKQNTITMNNQPLQVTGTAQNGKSGALVKSLDGEVYYIDGLSEWPSDIVNKQIVVTGILKTETISEQELKNEQGEWKQGIAGIIKTLGSAQWKLLNSDQ